MLGRVSSNSLGNRFVAFGRAAFVVLLLLTFALCLGLRTARAALGERLVGFGGEIARWEGFRTSSGVRALTINGAELQLVSATTKLPVSATLDRLEAVCNTRGGVLGGDSLDRFLKAQSPVSQSWLRGHLREESDSEGVVACLDTGTPLGLNELTTRLEQFAHSGDLNQLGALRYATARRSHGVTTVLFIWSEGSIPLRQMFPRAGDAPGLDPAELPRPPGSQRLLSGIENGAPYSLTLYRANAASPAALLDWYRQALPAAGFALSEPGGNSLLARKGTRTLVIGSEATGQGVAAAVAELK